MQCNQPTEGAKRHHLSNQVCASNARTARNKSTHKQPLQYHTDDFPTSLIAFCCLGGGGNTLIFAALCHSQEKKTAKSIQKTPSFVLLDSGLTHARAACTRGIVIFIYVSYKYRKRADVGSARGPWTPMTNCFLNMLLPGPKGNSFAMSRCNSSRVVSHD